MSADSHRSRISRPPSPTSRSTSIIRLAPGLAPAVILRLTAVEHQPPRPRWLLVAAAAVITMVVLLSFPAPREALADWLGIGAVRVIRTEQVPDATGSVLRLGKEVSLDAARSRAPFTILGPASLGSPSAVYVGEPSSDSITLLWGAARPGA